MQSVPRKKIKPRIPKEAIEILRKKSGIHGTKKGKKGYDRKKAKQETKDKKLSIN
jgi:hypothetical protein